MTPFALLVWSGLGLWVIVLLLPWRPWQPRIRLEPAAGADPDLSAIAVIIPARNEAASIGRSLEALLRQGRGLRILVVDDESDDGTAEAARRAGGEAVEVIAGRPLPPGWTGKLWALEQARRQVDRPRLLLLDAEIELRPGMVAALQARMEQDDRALVSVMARLRMEGFWERLLMPAFVWFFGLLYPFALANRPGGRPAAAAGGCMLLQRRWLDAIGGFAALRDSIIDDCTLAERIRRAGGTVWIGLSHGAVSQRAYPRLADVTEMVARSAFAQLRHSWLLLGVCALLMLAAFPAPWLGLLAGHADVRWAGGLGVLLSLGLYLPLVRYYGLAPAWALGLPLAGVLYLGMTLVSAARYARGTRARWRGRSYGVGSAQEPPGGT